MHFYPFFKVNLLKDELSNGSYPDLTIIANVVDNLGFISII